MHKAVPWSTDAPNDQYSDSVGAASDRFNSACTEGIRLSELIPGRFLEKLRKVLARLSGGTTETTKLPE